MLSSHHRHSEIQIMTASGCVPKQPLSILGSSVCLCLAWRSVTVQWMGCSLDRDFACVLLCLSEPDSKGRLSVWSCLLVRLVKVDMYGHVHSVSQSVLLRVRIFLHFMRSILSRSRLLKVWTSASLVCVPSKTIISR